MVHGVCRTSLAKSALHMYTFLHQGKGNLNHISKPDSIWRLIQVGEAFQIIPVTRHTRIPGASLPQISMDGAGVCLAVTATTVVGWVLEFFTGRLLECWCWDSQSSI